MTDARAPSDEPTGAAEMSHLEKAELIKSRLDRLVRREFPIVAGPFFGEVGFELVYWVPFVRWVVETYKIPGERLTIVSRGGTASWYGDLPARYADVFSLMSLDEYMAGTAGRKPKQMKRDDAVSKEILRRTSAKYGLGRVSQLQPRWMYGLVRPYWDHVEPWAYVEQFASYRQIRPPRAAVLDTFPRDYVAVRFYASRFFPDTEVNRHFARETVDAIERHVPVVLLNEPFSVDEHHDVQEHSARVLTVGDSMTLADNLAVQTAVIGRARAFVGTYGGLSYLAPLCGIPSVAVYSDGGWKQSHLRAAQHVFQRVRGGPFVLLDTTLTPRHVAERVLACLGA